MEKMENKLDENTIKKLLIFSSIFGLMFTVCFYKNITGIIFLIFAIVIEVLINALMKFRQKSFDKWHWFYSVSLILLSSIPGVTDNDFSYCVGGMLYIVLLIKWLVYINYDIRKIDFLRNLLVIISFPFKMLGGIFNPISDLSKIVKGDKDKKRKEKSQVLLGIVIAIPVLLVVTMLLAASDIVFKNIVENIFSEMENIGSIIRMLFVFIVGFVICYTCEEVFLREKIVYEEVNLQKTNVITGITFAGLIAALYVIFCGMQVIMLFSRNDTFLPDNYTYAQYARQGFFQLVFVCVINVCLVIICRLKFEQSKILKNILLVISGCTYMMIASSAYRMILYIKSYDLTALRLLVLWFLAVLSIVMFLVIRFILNEKFMLFEYMLVSFTVMFLLLSFTCPDRIIVKYNIAHLDKNSSKDVYYLISDLSYDAAVEIIDNGEKIGTDNVEMYCNKLISRYEKDVKKDVRKFNYSRFKAYKKAINYMKKG